MAAAERGKTLGFDVQCPFLTVDLWLAGSCELWDWKDTWSSLTYQRSKRQLKSNRPGWLYNNCWFSPEDKQSYEKSEKEEKPRESWKRWEPSRPDWDWLTTVLVIVLIVKLIIDVSHYYYQCSYSWQFGISLIPLWLEASAPLSTISKVLAGSIVIKLPF